MLSASSRIRRTASTSIEVDSSAASLRIDTRSWFTSSPALAQETAFRNGSLQGAYLMMAARSMGLDCGPLSGFKNEIVDEAFFVGTRIKSNFLVNIGYGDPTGNFDRLPRLNFEEAAQFQ